MSQQAALEHMESIIYDPQQLLSNEIKEDVQAVQKDVSEEATKGTAPTDIRVGDEKDEAKKS